MKRRMTMLVAVLMACFGITAYAETSDSVFDFAAEAEESVEVTVEAEVPAGFGYAVEIYFDGIRYTLLPSDDEALSYRNTFGIAKGTYQLNCVCPEDLGGLYSFSGPSEITVTGGGHITYRCTEKPGANENRPDVSDTDGETGLIDQQPDRYYFDEGENYGTLNIKCDYSAAVISALYRLKGNDKVYDITLNRDAGFMAEVRLPEGTYSEATTIEVVLDEDVLYQDGLTFTWSHVDNPTFFGNYYDVSNGSTEDVGDLQILMHYQGEVSPVNASILFAPKYRETHDKLVAQNREEIREAIIETAETIPEITEEETEQPTIAEAEVIEPEPVQNSRPYLKYIIIGAAVLLLLGLGIIIRSRIMYYRNGYDE